MKHIDVDDRVHRELAHFKLEHGLKSFSDAVQELLRLAAQEGEN